MRILAGRGYWLPRHRIPHLRRIAFLGDSYVYGQGVGPDETLPAYSERHLNETTSGWPIEAVNLGVCGYNLWNSWQFFRGLPQVYDAVVLTLCSNDAQLFGRSYHVEYSVGPAAPFWQADHRYHGIISACFDDMASLSRANDLPFVVCFYNVWPGQPLASQAGARQISKLIGDLCEPRGIAFVDFFAHFAARNMPLEELVVGEADHHPSKLAHDAAARHLALRLRQLRWLERMDAATFARVADRIQLAAQDLVWKDSYPCDIALRWAACALEDKGRAAKRLQSASPVGDFAKRAGRVAAALEAARLVWHGAAKAAAICEEARTGRSGYSPLLWRIDEEMLKLEELCATTGNLEITNLIGESATSSLPPGNSMAAGLFGETRLALNRILAQLKTAAVARNSLHSALVDSWLPSPDDVSRLSSDFRDISALAGRIENAAQAFLDMLDRLKDSVLQAARQLAGSEERRFLGLLRSSLERAIQSFELVGQKLASATASPTSASDHTTVEVTLATNAIEGWHPCTVEIQASYFVPQRLPLRDQRQFLPSGSSVVVTLRFPLIYAGQLLLSLHYPAAIADRVEADLVKVEIHNSPTMRRTLDRAAFSEQNLGSLVSQTFFMV